MNKVLFLMTVALVLISCKKEPVASDASPQDATDSEAEVLPGDVTAADAAEAATPVDATPTSK
jgi:hypothetical protein